MYIPKHFVLQEFVPRQIWEAMGDKSLLLLYPAMLITADDIRAYFGRPMTINNWHVGGAFEFRGFRPADCAVGAELSMHRVGGAFDADIQGITAQEARSEILKHPDKFPYLKRMEDGVTWLHADCKKTGSNKIILFKP